MLPILLVLQTLMTSVIKKAARIFWYADGADFISIWLYQKLTHSCRDAECQDI